jgi:hypothetical protein
VRVSQGNLKRTVLVFGKYWTAFRGTSHMATLNRKLLSRTCERDVSLSVGPFDVDLVGTDGVAGRPTSGIAEQVRG